MKLGGFRRHLARRLLAPLATRLFRRILLSAVLLSPVLRAHHLEQSRLEMRAVRGSELEGRFFLAPRDFQTATHAELLADLQTAIGLVVGGSVCQPKLDLIELWDPASPSPGHLIDVRCALTATNSATQLAVTWRGRGTLSVVLPPNAPVGALAAPPPLLSGQTGHFTIPLAPQVPVSRSPLPPVSSGHSPTVPTHGPAAPLSFAALAGLGYRHVVPDGLDHVLFVFSLALAARGIRPLIAWLLAFTVGHGIGLVAAAYAWLPVSSAVVEPGIALSVVLVAARGLSSQPVPSSPREHEPSAPWSSRAAALGFGVLHGLGFGQVFAQLSLETSELLSALVAFHLGVEAGHALMLAVGGLLFAALVRALAPALSRRQLRRLSAGGLIIAGLCLLAARLHFF